jgi:hypothetical protein
MAHSTKIATCCYCGLRAALVLDRNRHELTCAGCGAPLHDLKNLPREHPGKTELVRPSGVRPGTPPNKPRKKKRHKSKKRIIGKLFEETFDVLEDIFD